MLDCGCCFRSRDFSSYADNPVLSQWALSENSVQTLNRLMISLMAGLTMRIPVVFSRSPIGLACATAFFGSTCWSGVNTLLRWNSWRSFWYASMHAMNSLHISCLTLQELNFRFSASTKVRFRYVTLTYILSKARQASGSKALSLERPVNHTFLQFMTDRDTPIAESRE